MDLKPIVYKLKGVHYRGKCNLCLPDACFELIYDPLLTGENPACNLKGVDDTQTYLTTQGAADYLNVSKRYLVLRRMDGTGPKYLRFGPKLIRYRKCDLNFWASSHAIEAPIFT